MKIFTTIILKQFFTRFTSGKARLIGAIVFALPLCLLWPELGWGQTITKETAVGQRSVADQKWQKGGIFEGYTPEQEILEKRTRTTKHFQNDNGSVTVQIGGLTHYKDENGVWQDIDFSIKENSLSTNTSYKYCNLSHEMKSYFPGTPRNNGCLLIKDNIEYHLWNDPKVEIYDDEGNLLFQKNASESQATISENMAFYSSYENIIDKFTIFESGIHNDIVINSLPSFINSENHDNFLSFTQFIPLDNGYSLLSGDTVMKSDFEATTFKILKNGNSESLIFLPIIVYDNYLTKEEAQLISNCPDRNKLSEDLLSKEKFIIKGKYKIIYTDGGIYVRTLIPISYLLDNSRTFPVIVDPTWLIGVDPPGYTYGTGAIDHWYGYQRYASLYPYSEIGGYGTITAIEYYTATSVTRTKPTIVYMKSTSATTCTAAAWNSTTYTSGASTCYNDNTTQDATTGWKMITLTTPFSYTANNLLIMVNAAYGGSGSNQNCGFNTNSSSCQAYSRADVNDPGDGATLSVQSPNRSGIRITYTPPCSGSGPAAALNFDGSDDYVPLNNGSTTLSGNYTVECWAKPANTSSVMSFMGSRAGGSYNTTFDIKFNGSNTLRVDIGANTSSVLTN